jgi:hypothetical protein
MTKLSFSRQQRTVFSSAGKFVANVYYFFFFFFQVKQLFSETFSPGNFLKK